MFTALNTKITIVWLLLILATGLSWEFGHGFGFGDRLHYGTIAVFVITFIKVRFVYLDFMELKTAPLALRTVVEAWALIMCITFIALYWMGL
jgi:hypothetical protein